MNTFEPYKSPETEEIIPKMLQAMDVTTVEWLIEIFQAMYR